MDFHAKLAMWRRTLGLTLQEVGAAAGRSKQCVLQWERGMRTPSAEDVKAIAALFSEAIKRVMVAPPARKVGRPKVAKSAGAAA